MGIFQDIGRGFSNAGKAVTKTVKNIGKGISHAYKSIARAGGKLLKSPIVKGLILAAAIYFSAGTLGPAVGASLGLSGTAAAAVGTAAVGAATNVAVTGLAGNASAGDLTKAAGQGAVAGAVGGYAAAPSSAGTAAAGQGAGTAATQTGSLAGQTATQNIASAAVDLPSATVASPSLFSQGVGILSTGADWAAAHPQLTKMGLDAVTAATTPNAIDIANNQSRLENQARINRINGNQVPIDNGGVGLLSYGANIGGQLNPMAQSQVYTPSQVQTVQNNPALQYNAQGTAIQY